MDTGEPLLDCRETAQHLAKSPHYPVSDEAPKLSLKIWIELLRKRKNSAHRKADGRASAGPELCVDESVAYTGLGDDVARAGWIGFDLPAQLPDEHVQVRP